MVGTRQYWKNPELYRERARLERIRNGDRMRERCRNYVDKNRDRISEYQRLWAIARHRDVRLLFGDRCFICGETKSKLDLHHMTYKNGKPSRSGSGFLKRMKEAKEDPENFRLLCAQDHRMITLLVSRKSRIPRLLEVLRDMGIETNFDTDERLWRSLTKRGVVA